MSTPKGDPLPKYVRQRNGTRIFHATEQIMARGDFLPCDSKGKFVATGEMELPLMSASPEGPAQDKEAIRMAELREKARLLKVRGYNNAKEETLLKGIAKAEAAIAKAQAAADAKEAEEAVSEAAEEQDTQEGEEVSEEETKD